MSDDLGRAWYQFIAVLVGIVTFFACWAYAVATYGWFLGGGLGWIPSLFIGAIIGWLWPLLLIAIAALWYLSTHST